jgi:hypothetical protein
MGEHGPDGRIFPMAGTRRVVDWMPESDLLKAAGRGLTYDEIADLNYRMTGDRPTRFAVQKYLRRLGAEPRQVRTGDLMPWRVQMKDYQNPVRYMLNALASSRAKTAAGEMPTVDARKKVRELLEILDGNADREYPRLRLVVDYDDKGFCFRPRSDDDEDVVRMPGPEPTLAEWLERAPELSRAQRAELITVAAVIKSSQPASKRAQKDSLDQWARERQETG